MEIEWGQNFNNHSKPETLGGVKLNLYILTGSPTLWYVCFVPYCFCNIFFPPQIL